MAVVEVEIVVVAVLEQPAPLAEAFWPAVAPVVVLRLVAAALPLLDLQLLSESLVYLQLANFEPTVDAASTQLS